MDNGIGISALVDRFQVLVFKLIHVEVVPLVKNYLGNESFVMACGTHILSCFSGGLLQCAVTFRYLTIFSRCGKR